MQCGVCRDYAAEVVVEDGQDVVCDLGMDRVWPRACPFQFVARVGPEVEVGIHMGAGLVRWEEAAGGGVVVAGVQVGAYLGAEGVGLGGCLEGVELFGEGDGGGEEGGIGGDVVFGWVRWVVLGELDFFPCSKLDGVTW